MKASLVLASVFVAIAGCISPTVPGSAPGFIAAPIAAPSGNASGPTTPPSSLGRVTRIDTVELSADHGVVALHFVGGPPLATTDPCFTDYVAWAEPNGDRLDVAVFEKTGITGTTPCVAIGYRRTLAVTLREPFDGTTVLDRAGFIHFVAPPAGLRNLRGLPAGWLLRAQGDVEQSRTGRWRRVYSRMANPAPSDRQVEFYQSFGSSVDISGGAERSDVLINGDPGLLWHDPSTGELLVTWMATGDGFGLVANERDFTKADVLKLAASVL